MIEFILVAGTYLLIGAVIEALAWGWEALEKSGLKKRTEEWCKTLPLTEEDKRLIESNRELMKEFFPDGIEARFKGLALDRRVEIMKDLLERANEIYGTEIKSVTFSPSSEVGDTTYGYYSFDSHSITINVDVLASEDANVLRAIVGTVFHELRHAQQYKTITDSNYAYGTEEQRRLWALNFMEGNYISPEIDYVLYQKQTVEADARQIAEHITVNF